MIPRTSLGDRLPPVRRSPRSILLAIAIRGPIGDPGALEQRSERAAADFRRQGVHVWGRSDVRGAGAGAGGPHVTTGSSSVSTEVVCGAVVLLALVLLSRCGRQQWWSHCRSRSQPWKGFVMRRRTPFLAGGGAGGDAY